MINDDQDNWTHSWKKKKIKEKKNYEDENHKEEYKVKEKKIIKKIKKRFRRKLWVRRKILRK